MMTTSLVLLSAVIASDSQAAEKPTAPSWEYPELVVTPRASARLDREAELEKKRPISRHWAIQVSAATTLASGLMQFAQPNRSADPDRQAAWTGVGVGGAWLLATWLLGSQYTPYQSGAAEVSTLPSNSMRDQLARERAAEEAIHSAARTGTQLKWLSFLSNGAASIYLASQARDESAARVTALLSIATSLTPLIFSHHWNEVSNQQTDYKKRIFGPVAGLSAAPSGELVPVVGMQWRL
jgi:hypothetical protein